ncbi:MAG: hypothetical protein KatS3mg017_0965 [Fimbriimonadales bacterium]|nr:MAG: hypothetical protein KatS3mg017_0965 [Fimbriimonadales bacterium]
MTDEQKKRQSWKKGSDSSNHRRVRQENDSTQSGSTGRKGRAVRLMFVPIEKPPYYEEVEVEFEWVRGLPNLPNAQINARQLQQSAKAVLQQRFPGEEVDVFEVSRAQDLYLLDDRKDKNDIYKKLEQLSAYYLKVNIVENFQLRLEQVYQYSKCWGDPCECVDLLSLREGELKGVKGSRKAKREANLKSAERGQLQKFCLKIGDLQKEFPAVYGSNEKSRSAFYNWLYIVTIRQKDKQISEEIMRLCENKLIGFTDIFYKKESRIRRPVQQSDGESRGPSDRQKKQHEIIKIIRYNCQARALAQFVGISLYSPNNINLYFPSCRNLRELLEREKDPSRFPEDCFEKFLEQVYGSGGGQPPLPFEPS